MTVISRYILRTYLRMILLCGGAFAAIYLTIDLLEKIGKFTRSGGTPMQIVLFFACKLPEIATQIIPLAVLMATLLTLGSFSRNSELIAMRSAGAGLVRISMPLLSAALLLSLTNLILAELVVPRSYERMRYVEEVLIGKKSPTTFFRKGTIWFREGDAILKAMLFDAETTTLKGVTLWRLGAGMQPEERLDSPRGGLSEGKWVLYDLVQRTYSSGALVKSSRLRELPIPLKLSLADLKVVGKWAENMGFVDLRRYCKTLSDGGYDPSRYLTLLHAKLAAPFSPLVMAFIGIPFALKSGRSKGPAIGIGLSLVIGLCYFISNAFLISFGKAGALPPMVASWAANLLFIAAGIWLGLTLDQ
jgi:lipopolysaccharide export system permease protein